MGIWADTVGDGNSFKESLANTFTQSDGASYVGGTLTYDKDGEVGGGGVVKQNEDGTYGTSTDNDGKGYTGSANSAGTNTETTAKMVFGEAPSGLKAAAGFANPLGIIGKLAGWANGLDPATQAIGDLKTASGAIQKVYQNPETGFTYSYNYLGQPYEVADVAGVAVDKLSQIVEGTEKTGYQVLAEKAASEDDNDTADAILQEAEDNAKDGEEAVNQLTSAETVAGMADDAGVTSNTEDMQSIMADPNKFLDDRDLNLADLTPSLDPTVAGTSLDATKSEYGLGDNEGFTATGTGEVSRVADVVQPGSATYTAEMNALTDNEMVDAATGTVSPDAIVDAEEYTIDMEGAATGVNADGTRSVLGEALNDFASQDISKIIDTSTVAGKLLAQKLGSGNYTDSKATVLGQMKIISAEFRDSNNEPIIPPWAQAMHRDASKSIAFSGITGTAAISAFSNAIMEATLGVAEKDATFFQTLTTKNLDNRQQAVINKANVLSNLEMANLDARSQAAVQNAKSFMQMDLANLDNEQQAEVVNKQALVQAMFDNTSAVNAERLFTATTENDMNKFYSELQNSVERHNSSERNALKKFNAGEINDAAQFNADIKNDRQQFLSSMQYNIDISNAKWRQTVETTNNQNMVDAHTFDVKSALDLTQEAQNALWDSADNLLDYIWKTSDNEMERELRLLTAQMTAQSGQSSGGGFLSGIMQLGGAFLGSTSGSAWLSSILPSDIRLKENIQHYDTLNGINFYTWDWNAEGKRVGANKHPTFGVLAQEVQKTHPEAVVEDHNGYLRVNYGIIQNDI